MTATQILFLIALSIFLMLRLDVWLTRRKLRRLITEEKSRRWYPMMQQVARHSRDSERTYQAPYVAEPKRYN